MSSPNVATRSLLLLSMLGLLASCGDNDSPNASARDAKYVVASRIFSADGSDTTSYLHLVSSVEEGTEVDLKEAVEIPGSAKLFTLEDGWLAVGSGDGVTITRYEFDGEAGFKTTDEAIDLQPWGVKGLWDTLYVASATKVYYVDREGAQLVIINPKEMTVDGTVALSETVREGYLPLYSYSALARDEKLIFSVGWFDWINDKILPETGLVVLDTKTDEVVRFDVDDRCGGITTPVTLASGDTYYVSSALNGATNFIQRESATPCALRILAGDDRFDPDYALELAELTSGAVAGEPVPTGGNAIFLRVLNEAEVATEAGDASWNITGQNVWQWWKWQPGEDGKGSAEHVEELEPGTADVTFFQVEGRVYGSQTKPDYSETQLVELSAEGGPKPALTVPGFASGLAKL